MQLLRKPSSVACSYRRQDQTQLALKYSTKLLPKLLKKRRLPTTRSAATNREPSSTSMRKTEWYRTCRPPSKVWWNSLESTYSVATSTTNFTPWWMNFSAKLSWEKLATSRLGNNRKKSAKPWKEFYKSLPAIQLCWRTSTTICSSRSWIDSSSTAKSNTVKKVSQACSAPNTMTTSLMTKWCMRFTIKNWN